MQKQESIEAKKRWDVAEIPVTLDAGCTWGIPARHVPVILEKLVELGLIEKTDVATGKLKLNQFRILVRHLHQNGYNTNELHAALEEWLNEGKKEGPAVKTALDVEIQQVLSTLVSPELKEPFTIIADGVWGPASDHALEFIYNRYNIIPLERDNELLNVLISISQRVINISCSDDWINSRLAYNPFCLINNEYDEIALISKGNGVSLYEKAARREIVHFNSDAAARNNFINTPFARFSAWYMLLRMPTMNYQRACRLSIKNSDGEWMSVEQLKKPAGDQSFFIQPDFTMSFADFAANIPVAFYSPTEEPIDLIAVFHSGNLQLAITYGYSIQDEQAKGMVRLLDSELLFRDHSYLSEHSEVHFFQKADYCRIFVVKKDFKPYNRQEKYNEFPGTDLPPDFYKLITASASDIYYSVTIGLLLNESKEIPAFNQNRILVVGTGDKHITKSQNWVASSLGRSLADAGYGLISGGWPQVDQVISEAFNNHLITNSVSVQERLLQVVTQQQKPNYEYGERVTVKHDKQWNEYVIDNADAVVMIGGEGGTYAIAVEAKAAGIPVIPIPSTGGDALTFYNESAFRDLEALKIKSLQDIYHSINSERDAQKAAAAVMEVLQAVIKKPNQSRLQ